ncbi:hypothetical protein [Bacillus cereus group sp. BfR-BA-01310]|uniref:hypothetical protein n=1 Tax=Bacillus cereus group sp. BfR-BA-01310 TaxID=2920287 RepID=UPI001F59E3E3|nr:hypothetical protein [Bacillus cereus group sp. BfR-BA-01310]
MNKKTFEEWGFKLIPSSYGELKGQKRYYRVSYGISQWHTSDPDNIHKACTVFVQFGTTSHFERARKRGEIKDDYPCHILEQDLSLVIDAMVKLRIQFEKGD